jgi:excisionase family DNA binding protein
MKRSTDNQTLMLPGFLQLVATASGVSRIEIKADLTVGEAAKLANLCDKTIHALCDDGTLEAYRIRPDLPRSHRRIRKESLQRYLDARQAQMS